MVSELKLTDLKARLKDRKKLKTKIGRLKDHSESECSVGRGLHVFAYSMK